MSIFVRNGWSDLKKAILVQKFVKIVIFPNFSAFSTRWSKIVKMENFQNWDRKLIFILWKDMPEGSVNPKFHQNIFIPSGIMGNFVFWPRVATKPVWRHYKFE